MEKKGQIGLNLLVPIVAALLVGFVFLGIGAQVLDTMRTSNGAATNTNINNESHFANRTSAFNLSNGFVERSDPIVISNNTNLLVENTDYVLTDLADGVVQVNWTAWPNASDSVEVGVNYTHRSGENNHVVNVSSAGLDGLVEFGDMGSTMGLTAALLVVTLLIGALGAIAFTRR